MTKITPGAEPDIMAVSNRQIEEQRQAIRGDTPQPDTQTLNEFLKAAGVRPDKITDVACRILSRVVRGGNPTAWGKVLENNKKHWALDFHPEPISPEARREKVKTMTPSGKLDFIHGEGRADD